MIGHDMCSKQSMKHYASRSVTSACLCLVTVLQLMLLRLYTIHMVPRDFSASGGFERTRDLWSCQVCA